MAEQVDIKKMQDFVLSLLSSDKMQGLAPFAAEKQVLAFVKNNPQQFQSILTSEKLYPSMPVQDSFNLFRKTLTQLVVHETLSSLENEFLANLKFDFLLKYQQIYDEATLRSLILSFLKLLFNNATVRDNFISVYYLFKFNFFEKYITKAYQRKEYIYNELFKVSQHGFKQDESLNLLKFLSCLRVIVFMPVPIDSSKKKIVNYFTETVSPDEKKKYLQIVLNYLRQKIPNIDQTLFLLAIHSFLPAEKVKLEFSFSRVLSVLGLRAQEFVPVVKLDKGADTPDKSWFNIARKNYDLYGFDFKLVEEFFKIAADEGW